jgi:hypothetical protein
VHIAARVVLLGRASQLLASGTVKHLVAGAGLSFAEQGPSDRPEGTAEPMRLCLQAALDANETGVGNIRGVAKQYDGAISSASDHRNQNYGTLKGITVHSLQES